MLLQSIHIGIGKILIKIGGDYIDFLEKGSRYHEKKKIKIGEKKIKIGDLFLMMVI